MWESTRHRRHGYGWQYKINGGTVTTRSSYWSTSSNEREAVTVSGESSEYGDVETCRMPGWLSQYEKGTREMIRAWYRSLDARKRWEAEQMQRMLP